MPKARPRQKPLIEDEVVVPSAPDLWAGIDSGTSRKLLVAALGEFAGKGYHAATTRAIGERAGLSPAGVYVHFAAKSDLLFELCRIGHQSVLTEVETAIAEAPATPMDRLQAFVRAFCRWHGEHHVLARVIQYEFKSLPPKEFRRIARLRRKFEQHLSGELRAGVATGEMNVDDVEGTTLAILSLGIDLARWYKPASEAGPDQIAALYVTLTTRMVVSERSAAP